MQSVAALFRTVHAGNSWLVLVAGAITIAYLLVGLRRRGVLTSARRVFLVFIGLVHLQVVLGVVAFGLFRADGDEVFGGNGQKALWHAVLGVVAMVLVVVGRKLVRTDGATRSPAPALAVATVALLAVTLSRILIVVVAVLIGTAVVWFVTKKTANTYTPSPAQGL